MFVSFQDRVSLCNSSGCLGIVDFVDQAGLKLIDPPASAFQMLGLKVCVTAPGSTVDLCFNSVVIRKHSVSVFSLPSVPPDLVPSGRTHKTKPAFTFITKI